MIHKSILLLAVIAIMHATSAMATENRNDTVHSQDSLTTTSIFLKGNAEDTHFRALGDGRYRTYTRLKAGTYTLSEAIADGGVMLSGLRDDIFEMKSKGNVTALKVKKSCVVRITYDSAKHTVDMMPVTMNIRGNVATDNPEIAYKGNGVWEGKVKLKGSPSQQWVDQTMYFALNNTDSLAIKRLRGGSRYRLGMPSNGQDTENIFQNTGKYTVRVDLVNDVYDITAPIDKYRISVFGSSVANGQGADDYKGYRYLYGEVLKLRHENGRSRYPFYTTNVSIGGNTTKSLLGRYDDLIRDFGRYVIFGLSLGNEGIHGAADQEAVFTQWRDNMLTLIDKVRKDGKIPVVMNNYTRGDYNADDYCYVKRLNLLIHEWGVPSFNCLGAIDNGAGRWADGYMADTYHQNTEGHYEFCCSMVPSLFDALKKGKPAPKRDMDKTFTLKSNRMLRFNPEGTCSSYTLSLRAEGGEGLVFYLVGNGGGVYTVRAAADGTVKLTTHTGKTLTSKNRLSPSGMSYITLTYYHAQKRALLYVDSICAGEINENLGHLSLAYVGGSKRNASELFFWRSAMTPEEITAHCQGKMLKSSLEIYAPLSNKKRITNKAQSTNKVFRTKKY